jgi:hypothetical protein
MSDTAEFAQRRRRTRIAGVLRRPWLVGGGLALACGTMAALTSWSNWPLPNVHDEFSYLLTADTFAHGRLTNPPPPQWRHFETFHEIFRPTYASKYPPGQGLALAAGQVFMGEPAAGLWLMSAAAAAATYWMLLGWTSPRFALVGGLLWMFSPSFQLAWGQTYWGGTLAYLGGALVFGAALRLQHRPAARDAVLMGGGAVLLAVTRPYEGVAFCAATGAWLVTHWTRRGWPSLRDLTLRVAAPMAAVLILGAVALGCYHMAVTGSPFTFPYQVYQQQYGQAPLFLFESPGPKPTYRHAVFDELHSTWELEWYGRQATFAGWLHTKAVVTWMAMLFFFPPAMAAGALACRPWRWRRLTPIVIVAALTFASTLISTFYNAHYWAPFAPLLLMAAVAGLRRIDVWSRRTLAGLRVVPLLVAGQAVLFGYSAVNRAFLPRIGWQFDRAAIVDKLESEPGRHLIFVRYGSEHNCHAEWVFNAADIDGAKVVWARSMDQGSDAELRRYYADRRAWLLEPEARRLTPLASAEASASPGAAEAKY